MIRAASSKPRRRSSVLLEAVSLVTASSTSLAKSSVVPGPWLLRALSLRSLSPLRARYLTWALSSRSAIPSRWGMALILLNLTRCTTARTLVASTGFSRSNSSSSNVFTS